LIFNANYAELITLACGMQSSKKSFVSVMGCNTKKLMIRNCIHICLQLTPYLGKWLDGFVIHTILRGQTVYQNEKFSPPLGRLVRSSASKN
jgi:hypothetical protein